MIPAPPPGFRLDEEIPPPPPGFQVDAPATPTGLPLPGMPPLPVPQGLARLRNGRPIDPNQRVLPSAQDERSLAAAEREIAKNRTAPGVDFGPTIGGVGNVIAGAKRVVRPRGGDEIAGGASQMIRGAMEAAMPVMPAAIAAAPVASLAGLAVGTAAQEGAEAGARKLGAPEGVSALAGDVAGIISALPFGIPAARRMKRAAGEKVNAPEIRTQPEPVAPEPVAPSPAPSARPPQARPIEATPVAAEVKSAVPEGRGEVIQQSGSAVSPRASLLDSITRGDGEVFAGKGVDDTGVPLPQEFSKLRKANPQLSKEQFDAEILRLSEPNGPITLTRVDNPNPTVIDSLVRDPDSGVYYTAATLREAPRKETPLERQESPNAQSQAPEAQGLLKAPQARRVTQDPGERGAVGAPAPLTPGQEYVREMVANREAARAGPVGRTKARVGDLYRELKAKFVDVLSPVEDMIAAAQKEHGYEIRPEHQFKNQAGRALRSRQLAGRFVDEHGLAKVIKEVPDLEEFGQYLIAKHARNVEADGFKTGRDLTRDAQLVQEFAPKYEPYAQQIQAFDQALLDYTVDSGLISPQLAKQLRDLYPDYVPLERVFAEVEKSDNVFSSPRGVANLSAQTVIQRLKGSEREIENPIGSLLNKTYRAIEQGEKNKAARILASYKDLPGFEDLINPTRKFRTKATATFSYLDNGKKVTMQTTPEIEAAVKSLNVQNLGTWFKILAAPARMYKLGTTGVNIPFFLANVARDQQTAFINSRNPIATSVLNQKLFWKSMWDVVTQDKSYKEMIDAAAGGSSWDLIRQEPMKTAEKIRSERNLGTRLGYRAKHPMQMWRDFENALAMSEQYTRLQQFQGTKRELAREGRTAKDAEIMAADAARENTADFSRRGEWGLVLNAFAPYFNASLQGSRAFVRALDRQPVQTLVKTSLGVMFPVAMTTLWNLSDPEREKAYRDIRKHEKDNNFLIVPPNPTQDERGRWNVIKVPIVPGVGDWGIPLRRWMEQAHGMDPVKFREVAQAFLGSISPIEPEWNSTVSNLVPQAVKPFVEDRINRKLFTGSPIVPDRMIQAEKRGDISTDQMVHPWTSGTAKKIAGPLGISPIRVEEFVKGTMGGVGPQILKGADSVLAATGAIKQNEVGGVGPVEGAEARFTKAAGGEVGSKEYEKKASTPTKAAAKRSKDERLLSAMSVRDAIGQFSKFDPTQQAATRRYLQERINKEKVLPPYLIQQVRSMGFTVKK